MKGLASESQRSRLMTDPRLSKPGESLVNIRRPTDLESLTAAKLDPLYQAGESLEKYAGQTPEAKTIPGKVASFAGGMLPIALTGPMAPGVIATASNSKRLTKPTRRPSQKD